MDSRKKDCQYENCPRNCCCPDTDEGEDSALRLDGIWNIHGAGLEICWYVGKAVDSVNVRVGIDIDMLVPRLVSQKQSTVASHCWVVIDKDIVSVELPLIGIG